MAIADSKLHEEKLDAEAVLRQAERSGMRTKSLQDAIEFAANALSAIVEEPTKSLKDPPNPKPNSKVPEEPGQTVTAGGEEEEGLTELNPVPVTNRFSISGNKSSKTLAKPPLLRSKASKSARPNLDSVYEGDSEEENPEAMSLPRSKVKDRREASATRLRPSKTAKAKSNQSESSEDPVEPVKNKLRLSKTSRSKRNPVKDLGEDDSEEEETARKVKPLSKTGDKHPPSKSGRSKKTASSGGSGCSRQTKAEKDLHDAELSVKAIKNNIESLKAQLKAQELALKSQSKSVSIHRERVSNESENDSHSGYASEESDDSPRVRCKTPPKRSKAKEWLKQAKTPPKGPRVKEWVNQAKKESKKDRDESNSVLDELSSAAATVLRHQLLQSQKSSGFSVLEGMKIMERRRPSEKFTGEDFKIDFEDHIAQFKKAIEIPGIPASFKLAELKEWFGGTARTNITRYLRRDDHETALEEAIARLRREHGCKASTAEEMIEDILSDKPLKAHDAVGINAAISKLEEAYFLAVETDRDADFNRRSLFRNILSTLFPHLISKWSSEVARAQAKGKKLDRFEDLLSFLTIQKHHASEMQRFSADPERSEKSSKSQKKTAQKENDDDEGFSKVGKKPRKPRQNEKRKSEPKECSLCKDEKHWIHSCKKFSAMNADDRWDHCIEHSFCPKCLRDNHKVENCTFSAKCRSCSGSHNTLLHGAKDMPEELRRPAEVEKQA